MEINEYYHAIPNTVGGNAIPPIMGAEFAKNLSALGAFADMSAEVQRDVIERAKSIQNEAEMAAFIATLNT